MINLLINILPKPKNSQRPSAPQMMLFIIFFFASLSFSSSSTTAASPSFDFRVSQKFIFGVRGVRGGEENLGGQWSNGILDSALSPESASDEQRGVLVLAANRTRRPDVTRRFKLYKDGWNITNPHYLASVGFTGASGFILAVLWFISFGVALLVHHCGKGRMKIRDIDSNRSLQICLVLLLVFTCAAVTGCILLSIGQGEFHGEVLRTLKYVVNQSDYTVRTLRNVTGYLSLAKDINIDQVYLPSNVKAEIDKMNDDLNTAADTLSEKTSESSGKIRKVFNAVRSTLIVVAAVMLFVAILGLLLSVFGHQHAIYIFILSGWFLVAITFILCGVFLILNNATSDTCMAMKEWVENPQAETALSNILPCVDQSTTNKTLIQSKETINQLVNLVNTAVYTFANTNPPPELSFFYYNQSGPMMPPLCSPFDSDLHDRACRPQEVCLANASSVWQSYTCTVSPSGLCNSVGRITPKMYNQLVEAVNISYAIDHYVPPLLSLQNCNFVRETFRTITSDYCPPLGHYLQIVVAGLGLISVGVMLCLVLWILYANRPRREEVFVKQCLPIKVFDISRRNTNKNNNGGKDDRNNNDSRYDTSQSVGVLLQE